MLGDSAFDLLNVAIVPLRPPKALNFDQELTVLALQACVDVDGKTCTSGRR